MVDPSAEATFYGIFTPSSYPDKSNGNNPRYGKDCPLGDTNIRGRFQDLKIGDIIELLWVKRYQHGATMRITKFNKKAMIAIEVQRSYSPGTKWRIHKDSEVWISKHYTSDERLSELAGKWQD